MSTSTRYLSRVALSSSRRKASSTITRHYADHSYPFTKPGNSGAPRQTVGQQGTKTAYPFTRPSEPAPVAAPSGRVDRPGPTHDPSEVISAEAEDALDVPRPDYNVAEADYRTSSFSPIPMRVQDGSEDMDVAPAAVTSGAPVDLQARTVR